MSTARADQVLTFTGEPLKVLGASGAADVKAGRVTITPRLVDKALGSTDYFGNDNYLPGGAIGVVNASISDGTSTFEYKDPNVRFEIAIYTTNGAVSEWRVQASASTVSGPVIITALGPRSTRTGVGYSIPGSDACPALDVVQRGAGTYTSCSHGKWTLASQTSTPPPKALSCEVPGGSSLPLKDFDKSDPSYHCYHTRNPICRTAELGCNPVAIRRALLLFPAPRIKCTTPVWNGKLEQLASASTTVGGDQWAEWIAYAFFDDNFIRYAVNEAGDEIANLTVKGAHMFDPGWVDRKLVLVDGTYYIETTGSGVGPYREENIEGGVVLWRVLDEYIRNTTRGTPFTPGVGVPFCK